MTRNRRRRAADDTPHLPPFTALIGPGDDAAAAKAANALGNAMAKVEIDLRRCHVEHRSRPYFEPSVEALVDGNRAISHYSFGLPQIHRRPRAPIYPQLFRELSLAAGDALLRSACTFMSDGKDGAPVHYRALGRSAFLAAALSADRKLDRISRSFDFLLSVSPINTDEAMHEFLGVDGGKPPRFHYRPLEVDPDLAKRKLYAIDLAQLEDPLLETLFSEKRRELDRQLTMIGDAQHARLSSRLDAPIWRRRTRAARRREVHSRRDRGTASAAWPDDWRFRSRQGSAVADRAAIGARRTLHRRG